jgi:hypothetical protein
MHPFPIVNCVDSPKSNGMVPKCCHSQVGHNMSFYFPNQIVARPQIAFSAAISLPQLSLLKTFPNKMFV